MKRKLITPFFLLILLFTISACEVVETEPANYDLLIKTYQNVTIEGDTAQKARVGIKFKKNPLTEILLPISLNDNTEGMVVSDQTLTFNSDNYFREQFIEIIGLEDSIRDGNIDYQLVVGAPINSTREKINETRVNLLNLDRNFPSLVYSNLQNNNFTYEGPNSNTLNFSIRLNSQPTDNVSVNLTSLNTGEGRIISGSNLTFTPANWNIPQNLTVQGVDDTIADGDISYVIDVAPLVTNDTTGYRNIDPDNIILINRDNDTPNIEIATDSDFFLNENGSNPETIRIRLASEPTANVEVRLTDIAANVSLNLCQSSSSTSVLAFTPANYNTYQTCVINVLPAENDSVQDGIENGQIEARVTNTTDLFYINLNPVILSTIPVLDDDLAGIRVETVSNYTSESGTNATFRVTLTSEPASPVNLSLFIQDSSEASFQSITTGTQTPININSPNANLNFQTSDWNTPRTVNVVGIDDSLADGNIVYNIDFFSINSFDLTYANLTLPPDMVMINTDNDTPGLLVDNVRGSLTEQGDRVMVDVRLSSQPDGTSNVTAPFTISDVTEAQIVGGINQFVFNSANWNIAQTITIEGVDDVSDDGDINILLVFNSLISTMANFNGINPQDLPLVNYDNDDSEIIVSNLVGLPSESGGIAQFTMRLGADPQADVSVVMNLNNNYAEFVGSSTQNITVTFPAATWNRPITVQIRGLDDTALPIAGNQTVDLTFTNVNSTNLRYDILNLQTLVIPVADNDSPGILPFVQDNTAIEGSGDSASIMVRLNTRPVGNVVLTAESLNPSQGVLTNTTVTLNAANWNTGGSFVVTAVDDNVIDGNQAVSIRITLNTILTTDATYRSSVVFNNFNSYETTLSVNVADND